MADAATIERLDRIGDWPAPEAQAEWRGDPEAERTLLDAYRSGRLHHAWLIGGTKGIGKATLAYRFARFVLAHPDPRAPAVTMAADLSVDPGSPAFRKVAGRAHPNLLTIERPWDEDNKRYKTQVTVDEVRRTIPFFGSTGGEAGWRIAVVDPADDMNPSAANALLKVLEEPPERSLFLLVSHAPGRLLPTIRSRSRWLELGALPAERVALALSGRGEDEEDVHLAAALAEGSLRRAIQILEEGGLETYRAFIQLVRALPDIDIGEMHAFADSVGGRGAEDAYRAFLDLFRAWLDRRVRRQPEPGTEAAVPSRISAVPLVRWAEVWEKSAQSFADTDEYNLDRKQAVLSALMMLAHAARM